ncbi:hypothetical protein PG991_009648 [Apiospora marii]|uniref:Uncharacterized protein n=1 Tax=Apiospora marii TaxID=335849 RepID=A0ABR1RGH2_9PEZI
MIAKQHISQARLRLEAQQVVTTPESEVVHGILRHRPAWPARNLLLLRRPILAAFVAVLRLPLSRGGELQVIVSEGSVGGAWWCFRLGRRTRNAVGKECLVHFPVYVDVFRIYDDTGRSFVDLRVTRRCHAGVTVINRTIFVVMI